MFVPLLLRNCKFCSKNEQLLTPSYKLSNRILSSVNYSVNEKVVQNFNYSKKNPKSVRNYTAAIGLLTLALSFAAVPLYRIFCQVSGYGGTIKHDVDGSRIEQMSKKKDRPIKVIFNSDKGSNMQWQFQPQQREIVVVPGETALAFYTAKNPTDKPITGISTYNVVPFNAAPYFNKIQCFCFEEQQLNPKEEVDLPVFFYIDTDFCEDPQMEFVNEIILSYTFFEAKKGLPFTSLFTKNK